jgi:hypothetical protein
MNDPWADSEPQSGDFDADLATIDPRFVDVHDGDSKVTLRIVLSIEGADAERLERDRSGPRREARERHS